MREIYFLSFYLTENVVRKELCKVQLKEIDITTLRDAVEDLYYFEFVIGESDK